MFKNFNRPIFVIIIFVSLFAQISFAADKSTLDGFKDIKFNMSVGELTKLGFQCKSYGCDVKDGVEKGYTLFSQPARVSLDIEKNEVDSIDVTIDVTPDNMRKLFSKSLRKPKIYKYVSMMGYKIEQYYWLFSNNTSISVTKNIDKNTTRNLFGKITPINFSTATYNSKRKTKKLLELVKKAALDTNDF